MSSEPTFLNSSSSDSSLSSNGKNSIKLEFLSPVKCPDKNTKLLNRSDALLDFDLDSFCNEYGAIRSKFVRGYYLCGEIDLSNVVDLFKTWKEDSEYFILRGELKHSQPMIDSREHHVFSDYIYRFVKASKRGNDVYRYLVNKKLAPLNEIRDITFFKDDWGNKQTNLLFVTLTYDTNRCDVKTAWENIGIDYHLFCTKLRKKYGDVEFFRTWESTQNYYPHVHVLIGFKDKSFPVFINTCKKGKKKGKRSFRIPKSDKERISSFWHSNTDIQGVDNTKNAIQELTKYITKDLCSDKGNKTNSMIWLFRKQSYAISRGFTKLVDGEFGKDVDLKEPTKFEFIKENMCNCNQHIENWEFIGILRGKQLGFSPDIWVCDVKKPPPKVVELLIYEQERWEALHGNRY